VAAVTEGGTVVWVVVVDPPVAEVVEVLDFDVVVVVEAFCCATRPLM
jgi:hypothetical protein